MASVVDEKNLIKEKRGGRVSKEKGAKVEDDGVTAFAIWTEDIVLDPGNVKFPIRVVLVDNKFQTRFDRLVKLPPNTTTYIYRVLDHGIPWQHLEAGLTLGEVKDQVLELTRGKDLVMFDSRKELGIFDFTPEELSKLNLYDLKTNKKSIGKNGLLMTFWTLVREKLHHNYSGKPGNYDSIELTDFVMSIYLLYKKDENESKVKQISPEEPL